MKTNINVLVIDSNAEVTSDIKKYFRGHEVIKVVACKNNGEEGLDFLINHHKEVDVIVMDLVLPKMDGLFILNELLERNINKNIIITTAFNDENVLSEANSYGIDYYMLKPLNYLALEKRILNAGCKKPGSKKFLKFDSAVTNLLHNLGIPSHVKGYRYIKEGIKLVYYDYVKVTYITKDVYPEIAKRFDTSPTRVERAIRHAIEISWTRGDIGLMEEIFGNSLNVDRDKPTNAEYLTTLAERLKLDNNLVYS